MLIIHRVDDLRQNPDVKSYKCSCSAIIAVVLHTFLEPIIPYLVADYMADTAGYNVTQCVHVQALMPDPIEETR